MVIEKDTSIDTIQQTRRLFIKLIDGLSIDALSVIPEGFNNNIIWNFGHVIVSQQILCYKNAGLPLKIEETYLTKYAKGTKPQGVVSAEELAFLKQQSVNLITTLVADMQTAVFDNYNTYTTSFEVTLTSVEAAVKFLTMHEGLHFGYAMALKRMINK